MILCDGKLKREIEAPKIAMEAADLRRFENLIREHSGLNMREQEAPLLRKTLAARMQASRLTVADRYLDWLASNNAAAQEEWKRLFVLLTNQESYFFRDKGQLAVIRDHVLPQLIERKRATRTLRLWSAGCSTGEEPYSLAMMLEDVLPFQDGWRILILGTDLSEAAVERARTGVYGAWSFRAQDAEIQRRFFHARGNKWEVQPRLRHSVTFASGNLLDDAFPARAGELHDMDLIVCRNVFIYFSRDAVSRVLRKFSATLQPEGYLVTGHAELHDVALGDLQAHTFPQTVVYQHRRAASPLPSIAPTSPQSTLSARPTLSFPPTSLNPPKPIARSARPTLIMEKPALDSTPPAPTPPAAAAIDAARALLKSGRYAAAREQLQSLLEREPRHLEALCLAAQAAANAGHLTEAEALCRRAIEASSFASLPYHLLARIEAEYGHHQEAKALLKKVIYLQPNSVASFLELSALYAGEGDRARAAQMQRAALAALDGLKDDTPLPVDEFAIEEPLTVGELKRQLQNHAS